MDVPRDARHGWHRFGVVGIAALAVLMALVSWARSDSESPELEASTLLIDTVRLGDMVREVRGSGMLVPDHARWIAAPTSARVERIAARSGEHVSAGGVLVELANPDVQIQVLLADQQLSQAKSALASLRSNLEARRLVQEAALGTVRTQHLQAQLDVEAADSLAMRNLVSRSELSMKREVARELTSRLRIETTLLQLLAQSVESQVAGQTEQVERLGDIAAFQHRRAASLVVRSMEAGVLQEMSLRLGQWVTEGTPLGKVVQPGHLNAMLRIPESQGKEILIGQVSRIDTHSGTALGRVTRKEPSSQNGTVGVEIVLEGALPGGAVPDMSVDALIEVEVLRRVLFVARPLGASAGGAMQLFKLTANRRAATRVRVSLGRVSATDVEIVSGLRAGDRVILSDMSAWDAVSRIRLR